MKLFTSRKGKGDRPENSEERDQRKGNGSSGGKPRARTGRVKNDKKTREGERPTSKHTKGQKSQKGRGEKGKICTNLVSLSFCSSFFLPLGFSLLFVFFYPSISSLCFCFSFLASFLLHSFPFSFSSPLFPSVSPLTPLI